MTAMRRLLPAIAASSLLLLAGCGGGDDSADTSSQPADAGLEVLVKPLRAAPGDTIKAEVVNNSSEKFSYGADYELERQEGEDFISVPVPKRPVPLIALIAEPGKTGPPVKVKVPNNARPGQYRVVIQRDVPDVGDLSGEFEVNGDY